MKGHAALPDRDDFIWIGKVIAGVIEQDLAKPSANHDTEHAVKQQIIDISGGPSVASDMRLPNSQTSE